MEKAHGKPTITQHKVMDRKCSKLSITNSTGHLITYFTNGTGTDSVRINTEEEQYIVNFHTRDYDLNVGGDLCGYCHIRGVG